MFVCDAACALAPDGNHRAVATVRGIEIRSNDE
jgi:hypothetical protein